jgi:hypothetical protein
MKDNSPVSARIAIECAAATLSALTVSPAISMVDKAIVSNASGKEKLLPCMINGLKEFLTKPHIFLRRPAFLMIWGVYSGTYCVANSIDALCERSERDATNSKLIGSAVTNVTLSVLKDKAYARMFGVGIPRGRPLPLKSYGLFATRDSMTILASFTLPGILGRKMTKEFGMDPSSAENLAQLLAPCMMQLFSCPLHLSGLDLYNREHATKAERMGFIQQEYFKTAAARIARIFPAFGVGGVVNKYVRKAGKEYINRDTGIGSMSLII